MAVSLVHYIAKKEIIIANGDQTSNFSSTALVRRATLVPRARISAWPWPF
jgi:hypothetical protein